MFLLAGLLAPTHSKHIQIIVYCVPIDYSVWTQP